VPIHRVFRLPQGDRDQLENYRVKMRAKNPKPDTFLGRKTQAPFPKQEEDNWQRRWHSRLRKGAQVCAVCKVSD